MKFLLIQLRRIGDVMLTTPSIRALREAHPQAHLSFLTEAPSDQVLLHNPWLDEVLCFPKTGSILKVLVFYTNLRMQKYDYVIDFQGNPRTALLTLFSGASTRIGFNFRGRAWAYHHRIGTPSRPLYSAIDKMRLLAPLGLEPGSHQLEFHILKQERHAIRKLLNELGVSDEDLLISLSPVSRQPYKVWPAHNFAQVADWLMEKMGAKVLLIHGPNERHFVNAVIQTMKTEPLVAEMTSLTQTFALFEKVHCHLGNDNGPKHFAVAAGTPTVAIFGQGWAVNWTPPNNKQHLAVERDPGCKSACHYPKCEKECIRDVPVASVLDVLKKVVEQDKHRQRSVD